ncbi:hypothetical protein JTE90_002131 [Oedothorax gibbosus]|uniref:DNA-directed DNA polymerase n=1 Tax=Oedothorax gibbosus TaxID=931172 RepID=A0AAV6V6F4_9ARAC|nr:hypothetical protein JTE90_002131 [Oedothorax gibbosus]
MNVEVLLNCITRVLQSKDTITLDEGFFINIVKIRRPVGSGRNRKVVNADVDRLTKGSVITIREDAVGLCCAMAILLGKAIHEQDLDLPTLKKKTCDVLMRKAMKLHADTEVSEGPCGFEEIGNFERFLDVQVIVISSKELQKVSYKGSERPRKVYLWLHKEHYDLITSPKGFYGSNFYCEDCNAPFQRLLGHMCDALCYVCRSSKCPKMSPVICKDCDCLCQSEACYAKHKTSGICDKVYQCRKCCKRIERKECPKEKHRCDEIKCRGCKQYVKGDHLCFIEKKEPKKPNNHLLFFDLETDQSSGEHKVNFAVAQYADGSQKVFEGETALHDLCHFFFKSGHKGFTCIAHNLKGFDGQFILSWLLENGYQPKVIPQGSKLMCIVVTALQMRFVDSFNFLPMALSKLPKTFGKQEIAKGYFPHLFNIDANQDYVGVLPAPEFYSPDTMSASERDKFYKWYEDRKSLPFNFKEEMLLYCSSDVTILRECCLDFQREFIATAGIDPFQYVTIASACMASYRAHHIPQTKIAMMPLHGYINNTNSSADSIRWLDSVASDKRIVIRHANNGTGEVKIGGVSVDGFCEATRTIYQYHGCFYHGCQLCYNPDVVNPVSGFSMRSLAQKTSETTSKLRELGYTVIEKWEHDFLKEKKSNGELLKFLETHEVEDRLNPRDAFFGGRTNAVCLKYEGNAKYIDFTSLYPWCNKYARYPVGHPEVITKDFEDLDSYFGIIKCRVLPPRGLYHPVLPFRCDGKLMFPLCRSCCISGQEICNHNDEKRSITGTWVTEEVKVAIKKGYKIMKVYEVYNFKETSNTLFQSYIDLFLKIKQESSGWPSSCITDEDKQAYVVDYLRHEGIQLDPAKIAPNPGRRTVAKLALNSFWGRWGMNLDKLQLEFVNSLEKFNTILTDATKCVEDAYFPTEEICALHWRHAKGFQGQDKHTNVFIAAFTTCHARLKLYAAIDKLDQDVLYFDTDSIIYRSTGSNDPPLGNYLGEFTDELDGETIVKFASGGPKNYGYITNKDTTICKVRGFTLNYRNSLIINFDVMSRLIADLDQSTTVDINNPAKICRDSKRIRVFNREEVKKYRMVYTKRVIREDYSTIPYGY